MEHFHESDFLSWGDTLFLYLERHGAPLNVASVSVFEGTIPLGDCIKFVQSKLPLIPRYRQRVVAPPLDIGLPIWEFDPEFDVRNHVREVTLKRGTEAELKAAAGDLVSSTMDRNRPLWDLTLVRGLGRNRTGLVARIHHCLADGVAGVGLMNVIMDASPVRPTVPRKKPRFTAPPPREPATLLVDGLIGSYFSIVQRMLAMQSEILDVAHKAGTGTTSIGELIQAMPELAAPTERLPFNVTCRGPQKLAWAELPMVQIKAIRRLCGATVNDVIITVVTSAIRRYAQRHRVRLKGRRLRIVVPVNMRGNGSPAGLGNRISFVPVTVPLDVRDPRKLLLAVHQRMELLKSSHAAEFVRLAGSLLAAIPTSVQAFAGPVVGVLPISLCNLICTNVPGPKTPLYLLGHKMLRWYPYVPIGGEMGINCAVLSYHRTAYVTFTGDVGAAPDLERLEAFLRTGFLELREAAGVKSPKQRRKPPKAVIVPPAPPSTSAEEEHVRVEVGA